MPTGPIQLDRWRALHDTLGADQLASTLHLTEPQLRDLLSGHTPPSPDVHDRLAFLHDLELRLDPPDAHGLHRWLNLRRFALGNRRPRDVLRGPWTPQDATALALLDLAESDAYLSGR